MEENDKVLILKLLLKATFVLLFISVALKLLGLNVFGIDTSNAILNNIAGFLDATHIKMILDSILLLVQYYIFFRLSCINNNKEIILIFSTITTLLIFFMQFFIFKVGNYVPTKIENIVYYLLIVFTTVCLPLIIDAKENIKIKKIKNTFYKIITRLKLPIFYTITVSLYQIIIMFIRNISYTQLPETLYDIILNFDYTILLLATYYLKIKNATNISLNNSQFDFSLTKFLNEQLSIDEIKMFVLKIKDFNKKFKGSNKTDKVIVVLYIFFATLSELINLFLIIFIAYLNHAMIECFFIITSFFISRKVFGAFHLDSAIKCWMLSNVSFYLLSKLTINVGITFVVPILCGIALAYITSKFIKKNNKELYKGMSERDLIEITQDKKLTKLEFEILKKYYCEGANINKLTFIYHYSRAQLYRYKSNAEKKIAIFL
jgi:hypothetical protein